MKQKKVLIVGGGAAGMMAACAAAEAGHQVILLERNGQPGRKLALTGNGRCNVTNADDPETLLDHVVSNRNFLYSALYGFSNEDMIRFLREEGLDTKVESDNRIFPVTDRATDVIRVLEKRMERDGVQIHVNRKVVKLLVDPAQSGESLSRPVCGGVALADGERITADVTILAAGGLSYPVTGSDGEGLRIAEDCGHAVRPPRPALTPFVLRESVGKQLQGRVFRDTRITVSDLEGHRLFDDTGDILFTHFGLSGPVVLKASSYCTGWFGRTEEEAGDSHVIEKEGREASAGLKYPEGGSDHSISDGVKKTAAGGGISDVRRELTVMLDFFPDRNAEQLSSMLQSTAQSNGKKQIRTVLESIVPKSLVPVLLDLADLDGRLRAGDLPKRKRQTLIQNMKQMTLHATGLKGFREAMVTQGGVRVDEVDPVTMESRRVAGLRFAGEILDLDALTGGYNLQIAWSTGWAAGSTIG